MAVSHIGAISAVAELFVNNGVYTMICTVKTKNEFPTFTHQIVLRYILNAYAHYLVHMRRLHYRDSDLSTFQGTRAIV